VKELVYGGFGRITKEVWAKAEDHVLKIEKEYGKENCIDRSDLTKLVQSFGNNSKKKTVFSANKFTEVKHRVHNYWI
jgi:hypothetical protein